MVEDIEKFFWLVVYIHRYVWLFGVASWGGDDMVADGLINRFFIMNF